MGAPEGRALFSAEELTVHTAHPDRQELLLAESAAHKRKKKSAFNGRKTARAGLVFTSSREGPADD